MNYWTCGHICGEGDGWFVLHEIHYSVTSNFFFSLHFFRLFSLWGSFIVSPSSYKNFCSTWCLPYTLGLSIYIFIDASNFRLSIYIFLDASNLRLIKFVILKILLACNHYLFEVLTLCGMSTEKPEECRKTICSSKMKLFLFSADFM